MEKLVNYILDNNLEVYLFLIGGPYMIYRGLTMKFKESTVISNPAKNIIYGIGITVLGILILLGKM